MEKMQTSLAELAVLQELEVRPSRGSVTEVREIFAYSCIYIYIYLFIFFYIRIYIYIYVYAHPYRSPSSWSP